MSSPAIQVHITVEDGSPRTIQGGVKVRMIAARHLEGGASVAAIAEHYHITPADVHAALAYYYDHQDWFDAVDQEEAAAIAASRAESDARLQQMRERWQNNPASSTDA